MTDLPPNVYRLPQRRFDAIPGAPWVYWVSSTIHVLFENLPELGAVARPRQGLATADNFRFLRFWWEIGKDYIEFDCRNATDAYTSTLGWYPTAKGSQVARWAGTEVEAVNWRSDGKEIKAFEAAVIRNPEFHFRQGITLTRVGPSGFTARLNPGGHILDSSNSGCYPDSLEDTISLLGILNSNCALVLLSAVNPTINFQVGDLINLPVPEMSTNWLNAGVRSIVDLVCSIEKLDEAIIQFVVPSEWRTGPASVDAAYTRLAQLEHVVNDETYRLYGISDADRAAIEAELEGGGVLDHEDGEGDEAPDGRKPEKLEEEATTGAMTREELAVRWISYAVGVVLGRFQPGVAGALGRALYRRDDFAIGSLPAPDEAEFDELVGPVERFAYVDDNGGRHVFSPQVEQALADLALPDGIAVLDEGHPRDLAALVEKALRLMLDPPPSAIVNRQSKIVNPADEVIAAGANGDLRRFLEKDFFTKWHLKWYRKRPVYWPLQSAKRGYGFVLFHEKVETYTLYVLLRDYLDHKLNGLRLQIEDLLALAAGQTGAARRQTERQLDRARQLLDEVNVFAQTIDRIAKGGYQPEANWIDDGVILRLAPLWELIPIWKAEPKKYWERLEQGDYDWSHIAMAYWPDRVRAACRVNKSFAIAHVHEEWFGVGMS